MILQLTFPQFPAYYNIDWATAENKVLHDDHTVLHSVLPMYQDPNQYEQFDFVYLQLNHSSKSEGYI